MGLFECSLFVLIVLAAGVLCLILIEIDTRIRAWMDYDIIHRQSLGEINGADAIQALKRGENNETGN